ncbi:MAG TPA: beta-ketoacyl synthase N-terminal-like domain-containing protein, partial [Herpetosiphonaceae bacterium]
MTDTVQDRQQLDHLQRAALALKRLRARLDAIEYARTEPIAIIGMGCRLPGTTANVCGPEEFWQLLRTGGDAISEVPSDRWDVDRYYDANPDAPGKIYTRWGGFLRDIDRFDAQLFGIAPREAMSLDPQQRLLLEVVWEALEHAGQAPDGLKKTSTGTFIGIGIGDYANMQTRPEHVSTIDAYTGTGTGFCFASGRLSYILGTNGPSLSVDTACSSSLVAIHLACQSLRNQECRIALAGGVNAMLAPEAMLFLAKSRALSPTGRCRTFDAAADGFVRGEGCGVLVLKRLGDALADGDTIHAVIRGSAINHDGASSGLTVPNGHAQQSLIRQALEQAQLQPSDVDYVEAHGTGTNLGDPIELRALGEVLGDDRDRPLIVGSVKTNIGHLEAAAGVTGVIKAVLALQHGEIPPHLHFREPSPHIPWDELPLTIPTAPTPWPVRSGAQRIAGVSSFGLSGTNAHVLIAEAPPRDEPEEEAAEATEILSLSAKSEAVLRALAASYERLLAADPALPLADVCFTANTGRAYLAHHMAVIGDSTAQVRSRLADFVAGRDAPGLLSGQTRTPRRPKIAFLCTGQGAQYIGMGRELYATEPVFREALGRCDAIVAPLLGTSLLAVLYPETTAAASIDDTLYTQPALVALEYALAELWRSWGIVPAVVFGHSVGEYAAACIAGVFSLEDGLRLVVERARLMQALPLDGAMRAVSAGEERVRAAIAGHAQELAIAALNGAQHVVISGRQTAVEAVAAQFAADEIKTRALTVSHAFHSPLMQPMLADFARVARSIRYSAPRIEVITNLTGDVDAARMATPDYWIEHVLQPVQFAAGVKTLQRRGYDICIELGPRPVLLGMARQDLAAESDDQAPWLWLPSLRQQRSDREQMLESLAALHAHGVRVDWSGFYRDQRRHKLALPTYPFQQQRYWSATAGPSLPARNTNRLPGQGIYSPAFTRGEIQFEVTIDRQASDLAQYDPASGLVGVPSAAYSEMALAAGAAALNAEQILVEELAIGQALVFPGDAAQTIQILLTPESPESYQFQVLSLSAEAGAAPTWICHATGRLRQATHDDRLPELHGHWQRWLHHTTWQQTTLGSSQPQAEGGSWLILADRGGTGRALAEQLRARGEHCTLVYAGSADAEQAADEYVIDPLSPSDMRQLVAAWASADRGPCLGVAHLWSLDTPFDPEMSGETLGQAQALGCGSVLYLTQALASCEWRTAPRLWLITRGSQPVAPSDSPQPLQMPLWGLGYVIALEHPELHCACL